MVGEVGDDGFVAHAVGGGDEFGVNRADEVDQPRGAQDPRLNADRTQSVFDITVRGRRSGGLGLHGDQQVGVIAAQCLTVIEAAMHGGPGPRVQWGLLWSATQPDAVSVVVDVGVGEVLQVLGGGAV